MIRKSTAFAGTATAVSHGRPKSFFRAPWGLLLVVLYHLARAHVGVAGILAGVAAGPPLPQQIPALIELDFDLASIRSRSWLGQVPRRRGRAPVGAPRRPACRSARRSLSSFIQSPTRGCAHCHSRNLGAPRHNAAPYGVISLCNEADALPLSRSAGPLPRRGGQLSAAHQGRRDAARPDYPGRPGGPGAARERREADAQAAPGAAQAGRRRRRRHHRVHQRQPTAGRFRGPQVSVVRAAPRRSDPGGQPGPDPRRREVRLAQGLQVLDLRHLVDPPVDRPGGGKHRPHRAGPRPRGRRDPAGPPAAGRDGGPARAAADPGRAGRGARDHRSRRSPSCSATTPIP